MGAFFTCVRLHDLLPGRKRCIQRVQAKVGSSWLVLCWLGSALGGAMSLDVLLRRHLFMFMGLQRLFDRMCFFFLRPIILGCIVVATCVTSFCNSTPLKYTYNMGLDFAVSIFERNRSAYSLVMHEIVGCSC